jgi:hypothetical protein
MAAGAYGERIADMGVEAPPTLNARVFATVKYCHHTADL